MSARDLRSPEGAIVGGPDSQAVLAEGAPAGRPNRGWRSRFPAIPWNFVAYFGLIPGVVLVHEVWLGCHWNLRLNALRRIQSVAAGQRGGLSPVGLTETARPWRKLVQPYVPLPQATSWKDHRLGFFFSEVNCQSFYLYDGFTHESLADVWWFPEVKELRVTGSDIKDDGLAPLGRLRELRSLSLKIGRAHV